VAWAGLQAGDLVFWGTDAANWQSVYHTAIYVGGGQIVEATGNAVQLNTLNQWRLPGLMGHGVRPSP
jgi:cell wall-associated NlpC family hydrolase